LHTVPDSSKTEELLDIVEWLGGELQATDASLLEEWRRLSDPEAFLRAETQGSQPEEPDITRDQKAFTVLVRNEVWRVVQALAKGSPELVAEMLNGRRPPGVQLVDPIQLEASLTAFFDEYGQMRTDPAARHPRYLEIERGEESWAVRQLLVDQEDEVGWSLEFVVHLFPSRESSKVIFEMTEIRNN
jgi:hypothetical protein